jgi:tetratricopeptide (TPR) repeat protein
VAAFDAYQTGVRLYTQGRVDAAQQSFQAAVNTNSRYGDAWAWLGRIALEAQNLSDAVSFYDRARTLSPNDSSYAAAYQQASQQLTAQQAEQEAQRAAESAAAEAAREAQAATPSAAPEPEPAPEPPTAVSAPAAAPEPSAPEPAPSVAAAPRSGTQVKLLKVDYTHTSENDGTGAYSFFGVPGTLGSSLTAPVNYADGTVYQRLEVLSKPSDTPVQYQLCLVPKDISTSPACSNAKLSFSGPGVYENSQPLSSFLNYNRVNWNNGIDNVMLVVKDGEGRPIDSAYFTQSGDSLDLNSYFPMNVRFEAVIVAPGESFQGW